MHKSGVIPLKMSGERDDETAIKKNLFLYFFKNGISDFKLNPLAHTTMSDVPFFISAVFLQNIENLSAFFAHLLLKKVLVASTLLLFKTVFLFPPMKIRKAL